MLRTTLIGLAALGAALSIPAQADETPRLIPQSVRLYEARKAEFPQSTFNLNLCRLLERKAQGCFWGLPRDREPLSCDLTHVTLAFGGWCYTGVVDADPHFSQALMPWVCIEDYRDGTLIRVQNYLKRDAHPTPDDERAAIRFLQGPLPAVFDVRGQTRSVFGNLDDAVPLRKGTP